jgi:hypothetical protein
VKASTREALQHAIDAAGLTQQGAAEMIHVSEHTIDAWLKPSTSKSSNRVPLWAVELLRFKTARAGARYAPTCRTCGEEGHQWQRCGENL